MGWSKDIASNGEYWYCEGMSCFPKIMELEYSRLKNLLNEEQIFAAMLELKDVLELTIKLPVIMEMALCLNDKKKSIQMNDGEIYAIMLNGPLSLGKWIQIANRLKAKKTGNDILKSILQEVSNRYINSCIARKSFDVAKWRNGRIGHGALASENNEQVRPEIEELLLVLKAYWENTKELYSKIKLCYVVNNKEIVLSESDISNDKIEIWLKNMSENVFSPMSPFVECINGKLYLFDSL